VVISITGDTRLRLFPISIKPSADRFLVIRRDTGRMLQTTESGVESISLLRKGLSVDATRGALGHKYGCDLAAVDIMPLIECLLESDFVEAVDGKTISVREWRVGRVLRTAYTTYVYAPVLARLIRWAPVAISARVMLRSKPARDARLLHQIEQNMRAAPSMGLEVEAIPHLAARSSAALRDFYFERTLIAALPPRKLHRWMQRGVQLEGLEHLNRAVASERGVMLCAAHVSAYSIVPFALATRGYAQSMLMDATDDSIHETQSVIAAVVQAGYPCALTPVASDRGVRALVRELQHGKTVYLLIDPTPVESRDHVTVPFLGVQLRLPRGIAWLALRTQAAVIPVSVEVVSVGQYRVQLHAPLRDEQRTDEHTLLAALGETLDRDVRARPAAWLKWKDFGIMCAR
jgi:lauroyl/myristoyl acyltransferase